MDNASTSKNLEIQANMNGNKETSMELDAQRPGDEGAMSVQEQEILASIQELQRQLAEVKQDGDIPPESPAPEPVASSAPRPPASGGDKLVIVSNRLPVKGGKDPVTGEWNFTMSSGGLVTALMGTREEMKFAWIGWLGKEVDPEEQPIVRQKLLEQHNCIPVFLSDEMADLYYNGFSNDVLWPLFHYVPLPMYKAGAEKKFDDRMWQAYKEANKIFAEAVMEAYIPGTYVWVQDYHLMRLPAEIRKRCPEARIGWFLHTPFPSSEIYRILPVRDELLEGLVSADLVGFHTYDYARHFLSACSRVLEVETTPRGIEHKNHFMALGVYPIGIDPDHVSTVLSKPKTIDRIKELVETFKGRKILLGVDRLDYIKGMPHKLLGLELFLQRYPEWQGKVTLIQVGVPSRTDVPEYQSLANQVNQLVGRINGTYGTLEYNPVHYINQSVTQEELFGIYNLADVCIVTSVRDGMNLVCHEYVCAQRNSDLIPRDGPGVLILSEFAGSAQSLSGALRINPWNSEEVCSSIHEALTLSRVERELRQHKLYRYVTTHTANYWAKSYMADFKEVCANKPNLNKLPKLPVSDLLQAYKSAKKRLIISDYDGTLCRLQSNPHIAGPPNKLQHTLATLAQDPANTILICSGREQKFLKNWFGKLKIGMAAEYGFYYRLPEDKEFQCIADDTDLSWKDIVLPIMTYFKDRTPGSYIETKESSLTWHYMDADPHFGGWQAKDMQMHMEDVLNNLPLEILQGNRMVEVRHQCANKSNVVEILLRYLAAKSLEENEDAPDNTAFTSEIDKREVDFIFCAGDDRSDEDMFHIIRRLKDAATKQSCSSMTEAEIIEASQNQVDADSPDFWSNCKDGEFGRYMSPQAELFTVHIGPGHSNADFTLDDSNQLRHLLSQFADISRAGALEA